MVNYTQFQHQKRDVKHAKRSESKKPDSKKLLEGKI